MTAITPFKINVPEAKLQDLKNRLANTVLASEVAADSWSYGPTGKATALLPVMSRPAPPRARAA